MRVMLKDPNGRRQEGMLLAASQYRLRVMMEGGNDVTELRREFDQWITESGTPVELDCVMADYSLEVKGFCCEVLPRTFAASHRPAFD